MSAPDFSIEFPDNGSITFDLNKTTPSIMIALRQVLWLVESEACSDEEAKEISDKIETLNNAIIAEFGEDNPSSHPLIGKTQ
jgi:hypothetical protein